MRRKIRVLARDIERGISCSTNSCPIALAVRRARIIPLKSVCVGNYSIDRVGKWKLTPNAIRFINRFDEGKKVKPFSFYTEKRVTI